MRISKCICLGILCSIFIFGCRSQVGVQKYLGEQPPGITPLVFGEGIISIPDTVEFTPAFASDYRTIYFTRRIKGDINRIYITELKNGRWADPVEAGFTENLWANHPALSPDGKRLYFGSKLPLPDTDVPAKSASTWFVDMGLFGWSVPGLLGSEIMKVSIDNTGTIYYSDKSRGWNRCFIARFEHNGSEHSAPEIIDIPLTGQKVHPAIYSDKSFIIFDSDSLPGFGGSDLFISRQSDSGSWSVPKNLGVFINTSQSESCAVFSPDYQYLFFSRDSGEDDSSIYWVNMELLLEELM